MLTPSSLAACLVIPLRGKDSVPASTGLSLGLLSRPPTPEGWQYVEVASPEYRRANIEFAELRSVDKAMVSVNEIVFDLDSVDWSKVKHAGVFNDAGDLIAYGVLAGVRRPQETGVQLAAGRVSVRLGG